MAANGHSFTHLRNLSERGATNGTGARFTGEDVARRLLSPAAEQRRTEQEVSEEL